MIFEFVSLIQTGSRLRAGRRTIYLTETGGLDIFYKFLFDYLKSNTNRKEENLNGNDAICVVAIMLDPNHRTSLQLYLKGTKTTWAEYDQVVRIDLAWAHQCLVD